jgi:hypothetical protein
MSQAKGMAFVHLEAKHSGESIVFASLHMNENLRKKDSVRKVEII